MDSTIYSVVIARRSLELPCVYITIMSGLGVKVNPQTISGPYGTDKAAYQAKLKTMRVSRFLEDCLDEKLLQSSPDFRLALTRLHFDFVISFTK